MASPPKPNTSHQFWALAHALRAVPAEGRAEFYRQAHQVVLEDFAVYDVQQVSLDTDPRGASPQDVKSALPIDADRGLLHARQILRELFRQDPSQTSTALAVRTLTT